MRSCLSRGRIAIIAVLDCAAIVVAFIVALELRFDFAPPPGSLTHLALAASLIMPVFLVSFLSLGIYSRRWKFASFDEVRAIIMATAVATVVIFALLISISVWRTYVPFSVVLSGAALSLLVLASTRLSYRQLCEMRARRMNEDGTGVLIVGAGGAGELIARDMLRNPSYGYTPRAFVDDDPLKRKLSLQGIPVAGNRGDIPEIVRKLGIGEIFITIPSAAGRDIREIVDICSNTGARVKILPGMTRILRGDAGLSEVREVRVEDLLGREPVEIDLDLVSEYLTGKVVLVTGAAGSIGSELSREIFRFGPARLVVLDNDESALFNLQFDLSAVGEKFEMVIADIREEQRIRSIFAKYRPDIVFHSAALKHVPMMQNHPCEAVKNNVMGTLNLARAAAEFDCERFLLISTDKAVQPLNTMGATKRLSELIMKRYNAKCTTTFGAVRFGNVLGSRGSVVPIFESQIKKGGPVQVTHPEVTRYFMTITEAAQLVIQAGAYLHDGELFILDMGEPVRIVDLARKMIAIMGNGKPIDIQFTGLRPGEKLQEELSYRHEQLSATVHPMISTIQDQSTIAEEIDFEISMLIDYARQELPEESRQLLMNLVRRANHVPKRTMDREYLSGKTLQLTRESAITSSS